MAKGRFISKDISLDEKVDALSDDTARLLFTWMIPHLDCEGRMYGDAQLFKSLVAPRRNYSLQKVERVLTELEKLGLIVRYEVNKNRYLFAPNFEKHQPGLQKNKEAQSRIPPPPSNLTPDLLQSKDGVTLTQVEVEVKDKVKVKEEVEVEETSAKTSVEERERDFDEFAEDLKSKYSDLDFDLEMQKFKTWWSEGNRKLKRPKTALMNWMEKAREFKNEKKTLPSSRQLPKKYTTPEEGRRMYQEAHGG